MMFTYAIAYAIWYCLSRMFGLYAVGRYGDSSDPTEFGFALAVYAMPGVIEGVWAVMLVLYPFTLVYKAGQKARKVSK